MQQSPVAFAAGVYGGSRIMQLAQHLRRWYLAIACAGITLAATNAGAQCGRWMPGGGVPGINGTVNATVAWDPDGPGPEPEWLIAGGGFNLAGKTTVSNVAAWDGYSWRVLGTSPMNGLPGPVKALTVWDGVLYACGSFGSAPGGGTRGVARFDGTNWVVLTDGFVGNPPDVRSLAVHNGQLFVGGTFSKVGTVFANNVASWDGSAWHALDVGTGPGVMALLSADGVLYAGGSFITAGGATAKMCATWNGSTWSETAPGLSGDGQSGYVAAMTHHNGQLHIGGNFFVTGQQSIWGAARLVNGAWEPTGNGFPGGRPAVMAVYNGSVIAAGQSLRVQRFNGTSWVPLTGATDSLGLTMTVIGSTLYTGGTLSSAGGLSLLGVARFDGAAWSALGSGIDNIVLSFASVGGTLYAGGAFTVFDDTPARYIAQSGNGYQWQPVGPGLSGRVVALHDFGGSLYAGGWSNEAIRWDGVSWTEYNAGAGNDPLLPMDFVTFNNELVCVGGFNYVGAGNPVNNVAHWSGAAWQRFGVVFYGVQGGSTPAHCAAVYNGELYVGGYLTSAGGVACARIAKWNGSTWGPVGGGVSGGGFSEAVSCMLVHDGYLYIGGIFAQAGGVASPNIARWDGANWSAVGTGTNGRVAAMCEYNGDLVAGGAFTISGSTPSYLARWNGSQWSAFGTGVNNQVYALHVHNGVLHVGGQFTGAGGKTSAYYARWTDSCCPADFNGDGFVDGIDYDQFNNAFEIGDDEADYNRDGFVDGIDYDQFMNAFETPC